MAQLNNPAGRLHALLSEFRLASDPGNVSILNAWREVLGTDDTTSTMAGVAQVAALVTELRVVLVATGDESQMRSFEHFSGVWLTPIFTPSNAWNQSGDGLVEEASLVMLGSLSSYLGRLHPEGVIPTPEKTSELKDMIDGALEALRQSDLPEQIQTIMVQRFHDMAWALDHLEVAGPNGVKAAVERLLASVQMQPKTVFDRITGLGVLGTAGAVWMAFTSGPEVQAALEAWPQIFQIAGG